MKIINSPQPLARRIVAGFVLITAVVSGTFSAGIVSVVLMVEQHLVSRDLDHTIVTAVSDLQKGLPPNLGPDTRFYATNIPGHSPPDSIAQLEDGFSEFIDRGTAYYVFTKDINGNRYQVIQDQDEFETRERVLYSVVAGGFLISIALAWVLGTLIARRVMLPVTRLAEAVGKIQTGRDQVSVLAPAYPRDEVGNLARAFDLTISELRASLNREQLFTSDISHELRTPLMVISSSCELLDAYATDDRAHQQIARIAKASEEMRGLIDTLLLLARERTSDADTASLATLSQIANEVLTLRRPEIEAKGLTLELIDNNSLTELFKGVALRTVLDNLLRNAIHYTERGSIRLSLDGSGFAIEDSGIGIPLAEQQSVFQTFSRGSQARGEGLGLGLSLVRRISTSLGWRISIENIASGGTRFRVDLSGQHDQPSAIVASVT